MNDDKFFITIADLPDRENNVAEIAYDDVQWVEISQEPGTKEPIIQFYSHPYQKYWEFPLKDALVVLEKAKKRFLEMQVPRVD